jgi:hypothetical protein
MMEAVREKRAERRALTPGTTRRQGDRGLAGVPDPRAPGMATLQRLAQSGTGVRATQNYRELLARPRPFPGLVAQRTEHHEKSKEPGSALGKRSGGPYEGGLWIGIHRIDPDKLDNPLNTLIEAYKGTSVGKPKLGTALSKHKLAKELGKEDPVKARRLLNILLSWANGESKGKLHTFHNWYEAITKARGQFADEEARATRSPEEQARLDAELQNLLTGFSTAGKGINEADLDVKEKEKLLALLPQLRRRASDATNERTGVLPVSRRKQHKAKITELGNYTVSYDSYTGSISPKPNAFVLGELDQDYGELLQNLLKGVPRELEGKTDLDRIVAGLFVEEFEGKDAFSAFSPEAKRLAHKVMTVIFFAELSRHSIAPLTAAASFHAVASRPLGQKSPGLVEVFKTGSSKMRPLFAGTGGPALLRGDRPEQMSEMEVKQRSLLAGVDLHNYFQDKKKDGEELPAFIHRKTIDIINGLISRGAKWELKKPKEDGLKKRK